MPVTDVATTDVVTVESSDPVSAALQSMESHHIGSVVVMEGGEPIGMVTDRTIALGCLEHESMADVEVGSLMSSELVTIPDSATHFEALETMTDAVVRRLPIVADDGSITGIVTLDDLIMVTAAELGHVSDVIAQQADS